MGSPPRSVPVVVTLSAADCPNDGAMALLVGARLGRLRRRLLLVPLYVVQLGASPVELGLLAATAAAIGAPGAILFGRLANRVGHRRPLVLATLATVAAALAVVPLLDSITAVVVANAALWLVVSSVAPVTTMLVVDDARSPPGTNVSGASTRTRGTAGPSASSSGRSGQSSAAGSSAAGRSPVRCSGCSPPVPR